MRCQDSSPDSVILDFKRPSRRWGKVHRSVSSDCQTPTPPLGCAGNNPLCFTISPLLGGSVPSSTVHPSLRPSSPPRFFDISGPVPISPPRGVLTAAKMKTPHQAPPPRFPKSLCEVQVSLRYRSINPEPPDRPEFAPEHKQGFKSEFLSWRRPC